MVCPTISHNTSLKLNAVYLDDLDCCSWRWGDLYDASLSVVLPCIHHSLILFFFLWKF